MLVFNEATMFQKTLFKKKIKDISEGENPIGIKLNMFSRQRPKPVGVKSVTVKNVW